MEDKKSSGNKLWAWIGGFIALVVVVTVAAILIFGGSEVQAPEEENTPAAAPTPPTDDSPDASEDSGSVTSDMWGRRVVTPADERGNPLTTTLYTADDKCSMQEQVRTPEGLEIQRTHDMATVWSTSDGPSEFTGPVADGYSNTPVGAALAAWNHYSLANAGGDVSATVFGERSGLSAAERDEFYRILENEGGSDSFDRREDWVDVTVPDGFRILSCSDDLTIVELAKPLGADASGPSDKYWQVLRIPMLWTGEHWEMNGQDNNQVVRETINELDAQWSRWEF